MPKSTDNNIFDKLSPSTISVLKRLSKGRKTDLDNVKASDAVTAIVEQNKELKEFFKIIHLGVSQTRKEVKVSDWLVNAYNEAYISESESVEMPHLVLALLLCLSTDKYFEAKKKISQYIDARNRGELTRYVEDLTAKVKTEQGIFIGREREITTLIVNLAYPNNKPVLLVGESGSGKTAMMNELARRINQRRVPENLLDSRILRVKFSNLLGLIPFENSQFPNAVLSQILSVIANTDRENYKKTILFFDDLNFGVSFFVGTEGITTENDIVMVGAAHDDLHERLWDSPVSRMWDMITLEEQTTEEYKKILNYYAERKSHELGGKVTYTPEAITKIIEVNKNEDLEKGAMPGAGIKMLDSLGIYKRHVTSNYDLVNTMIKDIQRQTDPRKLNEMYNNLAVLTSEPVTIKPEDVESFLSGNGDNTLGATFGDAVADKLSTIEADLKKVIIGQDRAIEALSQALRISSLKLHDISRPVGTFMFLGPTGVGKTETAKALARALFGLREGSRKQPKGFIRIDMTEFSEKHSVSKLFGAPPGYVGYDDSASLCDFVAENPVCVVLFDEIDKAHPEVLNSLLHIMDEGEIRNNAGDIVSFENVIILMTSNHGAELINKKGIGFASDAETSQYQQKLIDHLKKTLKPEFINRFDEIIVYEQISESNLLKILDLMIKPVAESLKKRGVKLEIGLKAKRLLVKSAYAPEYGARELRRTFNKQLIDPLSKLLLKSKKIKGIKVTVKDAKLNVRGK